MWKWWENLLVSTSSRETLESWNLFPEKLCKSLSLEREKVPFSVVEKLVYMVNLHSGMENIIPPSNLCCTNLKTQDFDVHKINLIMREFTEANAKVMDWAKFWCSKKTLRPASWLVAFSGRMLINLWRKLPTCACESKRKSSAPEHFLNSPVRPCTEIVTPHN